MEPVVRGRPTSLCLCARTLLLLPSVECQHPPKLSVPAGLLPTVGPLLSIAEGDSFPADALISIGPSVQGHPSTCRRLAAFFRLLLLQILSTGLVLCSLPLLMRRPSSATAVRRSVSLEMVISYPRHPHCSSSPQFLKGLRFN
ncbi:hypothetical protein ZWY2020_057926 [Hordeum vulgare]|nr:hypothetical protein ZWY2020_057926 [Hordeum vulgare]